MRTLAIMLAAGAVLAACGGGGGSDTPPPAGTVPPSATASPQAYTRYVGSLPADDQGEPLKVDDVVAPASDSDEPELLR